MGKWYSLTRWKLYAVLAAAFLLGCFGIRSMLLQRGADRLEARIAAKRLKNVATAKEVEDEVEALSDADLSRRASVWVRGSKR